MAVPTYGTDIVTLDGSVYTATGGTSLVLNDYAAVGSGQAGLNEETDFYLIGTECISKNAFGNGAQEKGIVDDTNAGGNIATTLASGNNPNGAQYVYVWVFFSAPASLETSSPGALTSAGLTFVAGPNATNLDQWNFSGSDQIDYGADWLCAAVDVTHVTRSATLGSGAGGNFSAFGAVAKIPTQGPTKGAPFAIEGVRRGAYIDVIDGEVANPATFVGLEGFDGGNQATGRLGVFTERRGVYVINTEIRIGSSTSLCYFEDTGGTTISRQFDILAAAKDNGTNGVDNEIQGGKNLISIRNAASTVIWESVTILPLAGVDIVAVDNATINFTACSLFGVRSLRLGSNSTMTRCSFGTGSYSNIVNTFGGTFTTGDVTQNGATITNCTVFGTFGTNTNSGIEVSGTNGADLFKITNCNFESKPASPGGQALRLGQITADSTVTYDGHTYNSDYATGATQAATAGPQGDRTCVITCDVDPGVTLTIDVTNTNQIPSVFNEGTGSVIIRSSVQVTISGLLGNTEISVLESPSPYSQTLAEQQAGSGPVSLVNTDFVSAVTGTDIELDTGGGANVTQILRSGSTDFTDMTGLVAGDIVRVTERITGQNLRLFDEFEVVSVSASAIDVVDVASSTVRNQNLLDTSASGRTITVEKVDAEYTFTVDLNQQVDVLIFRVGSLPILLLEEVITNNNKTFPVSQVLDRNFEV